MDPKWKVIFHDSTEPVAKGTWSTNKDDPSWCSGYRRYAASKMCELLMMYVIAGDLDVADSGPGTAALPDHPGHEPGDEERNEYRQKHPHHRLQCNVRPADRDLGPGRGLHRDGQLVKRRQLHRPNFTVRGQPKATLAHQRSGDVKRQRPAGAYWKG